MKTIRLAHAVDPGAMLAEARLHKVELAILTDASAACGTQVIYEGCRLIKAPDYQRGVGVAAALLIRHGIPVVSQRDYRTLGLIRARLDPTHALDPSHIDHHQTEWFIKEFIDR